MSQYKSQVQNLFLSDARKRHKKVEIVLETGTVLKGKIKAYDQFSISLNNRDKTEVIYKSSIIYISAMPPRRNERDSGGSYRSYDSNRPSRDRNYNSDDPPPPKKYNRY